MRKIAIVTGTRAEYGLLYWIIKGIHEDSELELQLIVTGMHLSSDTESVISTSVGLGMIASNLEVIKRLKRKL